MNQTLRKTARRHSGMHVSGSDILFDVIVYVILIFALIVVAYPLINVLSASFSSASGVSAGQVVLLPVRPSLVAYKMVIGYKNIWIGYRNSLCYMVVGTLMALFTNVLAAFPLSRKEFVGRRVLTLILAITMYVHGGLVPTYLVISSLGLLDTFWVMVIPGAASVWHIIMIRTYFQNSIPDELYEASQLDGCSDLKYLQHLFKCFIRNSCRRCNIPYLLRRLYPSEIVRSAFKPYPVLYERQRFLQTEQFAACHGLIFIGK